METKLSSEGNTYKLRVPEVAFGRETVDLVRKDWALLAALDLVELLTSLT